MGAEKKQKVKCPNCENILTLEKDKYNCDSCGNSYALSDLKPDAENDISKFTSDWIDEEPGFYGF